MIKFVHIDEKQKAEPCKNKLFRLYL